MHISNKITPTVDLYFDNSRVTSKVVFQGQPPGTRVLFLRPLDGEEGVALCDVDVESTSRHGFVVTQPLHTGFGVASERNLEHDLLTLLVGRCLLEALRHVDLWSSCNSK